MGALLASPIIYSVAQTVRSPFYLQQANKLLLALRTSPSLTPRPSFPRPSHQQATVKLNNEGLPKDAVLYPNPIQMLGGQPSSTSIEGLAAAGAAFGATFLLARMAVFGPLHRKMAKEVMCHPGTNTQKRILTLKDFLISLTPVATAIGLNVAVAAAPAGVAKGYVEGKGRFEDWGPDYYEKRVRAITEHERVTHPRAHGSGH